MLLWLFFVSSAAMLQACTSTPGATDPPSPSPSSPDTSPTVLLDFEGASAGASTFQDKGLLGGDAAATTVDGGNVKVESVPDGNHVLRFPTFDTSARPARAVLVMQPPAGDSRLDPEDEPFEFGVDFKLDSVSEGVSSDNGNNLVQRGLAADPTQYKLQVEHRRASCRVAGDAGEVVVASKTDVEDDTWYLVTCARAGDEVTLTLRSAEGGPVEKVSKSKATGALIYPADTPLVVGGKVSGEGVIVSKNSDQFNGALDNVFVRIGSLGGDLG